MPPPNLDRVQAVKWESSEKGGTEEDIQPVGMDETEDALSGRGFYFQPSGGPADEAVLVWRDGNDLKLQDAACGPYTLTTLAANGITETQHKTLRNLVHFIDNGPAEGFASGAYKEVTGTLFPTAIIWYDQSGAGKKKIVSKEITWTGVTPTTITWKVYDTSEVLLATVTDTVTYSGLFETSRSRAIT
jgi:hypothetical protein